MNANTREGSRRNIASHYDLGNDFYALWLDPTMTYSSARFDGDTTLSLQDAQTRKYQRMLDLLELPAGQSLLEIGCGWGGFAEHAARTAQHQVRGITLSREQLDYARARIRQAGLQDRCRFDLQDYREEARQYDGIVSIEMFEAVGEAYWPAYFDTLKRSLKPGGRAVVQTILIDDALFDRYRTGSDFIQQYVFPGGMLPSQPPLQRGGGPRRPHRHRRRAFRPRLRRNPQALAARLPRRGRGGAQDRLRRALHAHLALLSGVLRGRLPRRFDRCGAVPP